MASTDTQTPQLGGILARFFGTKGRIPIKLDESTFAVANFADLDVPPYTTKPRFWSLGRTALAQAANVSQIAIGVAPASYKQGSIVIVDSLEITFVAAAQFALQVLFPTAISAANPPAYTFSTVPNSVNDLLALQMDSAYTPPISNLQPVLLPVRVANWDTAVVPAPGFVFYTAPSQATHRLPQQARTPWPGIIALPPGAFLAITGTTVNTGFSVQVNGRLYTLLDTVNG